MCIPAILWLALGDTGAIGDDTASLRAPEGSIGEEIRTTAEDAIVSGGVVIYRSRHAASGAALGCASGGIILGGSALAFAAATGGAAAASIPWAARIGCGIGAALGVAIGRPLDR
jgi:hypothetical protein